MGEFRFIFRFFIIVAVADPGRVGKEHMKYKGLVFLDLYCVYSLQAQRLVSAT